MNGLNTAVGFKTEVGWGLASPSRPFTLIGVDQRSYSTPGPVSTGMGDRLQRT